MKYVSMNRGISTICGRSMYKGNLRENFTDEHKSFTQIICQIRECVQNKLTTVSHEWATHYR